MGDVIRDPGQPYNITARMVAGIRRAGAGSIPFPRKQTADRVALKYDLGVRESSRPQGIPDMWLVGLWPDDPQEPSAAKGAE